MPNRGFPFNQPIHPQDNNSINKVFDRNYGNVLKSGDTTELKYTIKDGDGEPLDHDRLLTMDTKVILKHNGIVAYENTFNASIENETENYDGDLEARFKVREVLPPDEKPYIIEFHFEELDQSGEVIDRFIFPSGNTLELLITPSAFSSDDEAIIKTSDARLKELIESSRTLTDVKTQEQERIANEIERESVFNDLVDTGVMQENINQKLAASEAEYAPRLTSLEQNDAELTAQLAHNVHKVRIGDSTEKIQSIIDMSRHVVFETGHYDVNELILHDNLIIDFQGSTLKMFGGQLAMKSVLSSELNKNIILLNGTIDGNREENGHNSGLQDGGNHGLKLLGSDNIYLKNMKFVNCGSDGMYVGEEEPEDSPGVGSRNVHAFNCIFDNNMRQGVSVTNVINIKFYDCEFTNTNGKLPEAGIDFEPNNSQANVDNVEMVDCRVENNNGRGIMSHLANREYHNWRFENVMSKNNEGDDVRFTSGGLENIVNNISIENCDLGKIGFNEFSEYNDVVISSSKIDWVIFNKNHEVSVIDSELRLAHISDRGFYKKITFKGCRFDGLGTTGYGVEFFLHDDSINDVKNTNFTDCIFTGYKSLAIQRLDNASVISCVFFDNLSDRSSVIEPKNNVNIFKSVFYKNSVAPIRIPSTSSQITCIGNISDVAFPSGGETNTVHSNTIISSLEQNDADLTAQLAQTVGANVLDYNSLQEAMDSGHTNLVIPKGVYEVPTSLKVPDGVNLIGIDQPVLLISETSDTSEILMLQGSSAIEGIVFDGNKHNNTTTASPDGINLAGNDFDIKISNCTFKDISGRGIAGYAKNATIKNCDFEGVSWYPIRVFNVDYFLVDGCSFYISETDTTYDSEVRAILPEKCKRVTITNCFFDTEYMYRDGIWMSSCEDVVITNNHISRTLDDHVTIGGVSKRVVIANNVLRYSRQTSGVLMLGSTDRHTEIIINGNVITDCVAGVDLRSTDGVIITGNSFKNMGEGIRFSSDRPSSNATVANNNFEELDLYGVSIGTSTNIRIDNNNFKGTGARIGVHGGNGNDVYVTNNSFSGFDNGIQTVKGNMKILGNNFSLISNRGVELSHGKGVTISENNFIDVPSPIVSPVLGPSEDVIISDNIANLEVLGYSAINLGVSKNILITGNRVSGYTTAVWDEDLAQGKPENIIATSNNFMGCTNVSRGNGVNVSLANNLI